MANITPQDNNNALSEFDESILRNKIADLTKDFIYAEDANETREIIEKYNAYLIKKAAIRTGKLENLYDSIVEQMLLRFKTRGGEFSNKDLLDYLDSIQVAIEKSTNKLNNVDEAPIQYNPSPTQVNINVLDGFTHEQKANIADAIRSIISSASTTSTTPFSSSAQEYTNTTAEDITNTEDNSTEENTDD